MIRLSDSFGLHWDVKGYTDALRHIDGGLDVASRAALTELANIMERAAKDNFSGAHRKGQPHVGGSKPNIVTGNLRRSIQRESVQRLGPGAFMTRVYPTAKYARAIELGNPRSHSGAYPYFGPGVRTTRERAQEVLARYWSSALLNH